MYYDDSDDRMYICDGTGTWSQTGGASLWELNATDLYPLDTANRDVGIGITTPAAKLHVDGRLKVDSGTWGTQGFGVAPVPGDMEDFWYDGGTDETYFFRHIGPNTGRLIIGHEMPSAGPMWPIMGIYNSGNVIIGPDALTVAPAYRLHVTGDINVTGDIRKSGTAYVNPDYVFEPEYALLSLKELKKFITENKRLPNMPSTQEIKKNGVKIFDQNRLMLEKLE